MVKSEKNGETVLLAITIIVSILSQIDALFNVLHNLVYISWGLLILFFFFKSKGKIPNDRFIYYYFFILITFIIFCCINEIFNPKYLIANYLKLLPIPFLSTIIADMYGREFKGNFQKIIWIYVLCALIYAIYVNFTYFNSYTSWLSLQVYAFVSKNSAAQIWLTSSFLLLFGLEYKNKKIKILGYVIAAYFLFITALSQCRTALLGVIVSTVLYVILISKKKALNIVVLTVFLIFIWKIPTTHEFIKQSLLLNKYAGSDLNAFSSGRVELIQNAIEIFESSPIVGVGKSYVDCSYVSILAESGLIGFLLIESVWLYRIIINYIYIYIYIYIIERQNFYFS